MLLVPRTCLRQSDTQGDSIEGPMQLSDTRRLMAYVLLGDPGLGKSEALKQEADASGGHRISAADFLALDQSALRNSELPVYIDGLDETRAGTSDGRVPLDHIRAKLQQLGCRSFRLSCRAADWLGNPDAARLQSLLPAGQQVHVFDLQPLTLVDVRAILAGNHGIPDPQAFITSAEQHGLTDLLFNPQTLRMLATAVGPENRWPDTRLAVYEMACDRLVQEHNEEHVAATLKSAPDQGALLRAAAYLCAIQLIADLAGFTRSPHPPDRVLRLNAVPNPEGLPLDEALASRIFQSMGHHVFAPVHRTVGEFLTARCLADRLRGQLTLRRVLALIGGEDGGVVSSMRGLTGWLATMSPAARLTLTRLDSLGVLLYGDAKNFSITEKSALMDRLGGNIGVSASFRWYEWEGRPFAALVAPEMRPAVALRLTHDEREENHQLLLLALLEGLLRVPHDATLAPLLLNMVRDTSYWPAVRGRALKVYQRWTPVNAPSMRALLTDIGDGAVADDDDELLGSLLTVMYPQAISSADLPAFLHSPKRKNLIGRYTMFWRRDLTRLENADAPALLDAFAMHTNVLTGGVQREYAEATGGLLARVLTEGADDIPDDRLLNWLNAACGKHAESLLENDDKQVVQEWLHTHPQRYFSLLNLAMQRYGGKDKRVWLAEHRLHGAKPPADEAAWWLAKADAASDEAWAKEYFVQALHAIPDEYSPAVEHLLNACDSLAVSRGWHEQLAGRLTCDFERWDWKLKEAATRQERRREAGERRGFYRARLADFSLPLVPLDLLNTVAEVYEHSHYDLEGDTPLTRLASLFDGDDELVSAALGALRNAIRRSDLPSVEETLGTLAEGRAMVLNTPALISLELAYRQDPTFINSLPNDRLVASLVAHLVHSVEDHDTWVGAAIASHPQCMADALSAYLTAAIQKTRHPHVTHLFRNPAYAEVAQRCLLPLLAQFPLHVRESLRSAFTDMLHAALMLPQRDALLSLVQARMAAPKVDGQQRSCWLAAGLLLDPDRYLPLASCYLRRRAPAIQHLANFLYYRGEIGGDVNPRPPNVLGFLIEHFAVGCLPARGMGAGRMSLEMNRADLVKRYIAELAGRPDAESGRQLQRLESLPALAGWAPKLREAHAAQQVVRRDATYQRPTSAQVCEVLQQGMPTTPGDIAAVVNDMIEDLKELIRHSDLNLNLAYWNTDKHKKATNPKHEELCRNAFTDQLQVRLERFELACLPETQHVDGKRSDVWCTSGSLGGVPIEVKLDRHSELWMATRGQLMARYATDPRAQGRGIYVVLWLGDPKQIPLPPSGVRPQTPEELQAMLEAGLSDEERRTIAIHVLDSSVRGGK